MWTPHVSLSSFTPEAFSVGAFGQSTFSLWAGAFLFEPFSVFLVKSLDIFCFITDESLDRNLYNFLIKRDFLVILFLRFLKFCLVFYGIYLEIFWRNFYARVGFHVSARFRYAVGSRRGDGAANFAELDSDFSEPGKHV